MGCTHNARADMSQGQCTWVELTCNLLIADGFRTAEDGLNHSEYCGLEEVDFHRRSMRLAVERPERALLATAAILSNQSMQWEECAQGQTE